MRVVDELEPGDWAATVLTGKPFAFAAGADIDSPEDGGGETRSRGPAPARAFGRIGAPPYPLRRGDQRRLPRRRARTLVHCSARTLRPPSDFGLPEVSSYDHPGLGCTQLAPQLTARRRRV